MDVTLAIPELAFNCMTMPKNIAFAKFFGSLAKALVDVRDKQVDKENQMLEADSTFSSSYEAQCRAQRNDAVRLWGNGGRLLGIAELACCV